MKPSQIPSTPDAEIPEPVLRALHELNNVLGPMILLPDLIRHEIAPESPLGADLKTLQDSARRAARILTELKSYLNTRSRRTQ